MALRHEPDVSAADWFTESSDPWTQLCSIGPSGFPAYARLFHPGDPDEDEPEDSDSRGEPDRDELQNREGDLPAQTLRRLLMVLARHTTTPQDCFFALWEGFGDIHGSPAVSVYTAGRRPWFGGRKTSPTVPAAFPQQVLDGPRMSIPARDYLLFRGPLGQAGQWGAADLLPGHPRRINSPNLMWPADHSWFVATEIDLPWTGVGGTTELVEHLLADPSLDVEPSQASVDLPYWRTV
jgi:hypothetical protein